jgi:hypothetical protein
MTIVLVLLIVDDINDSSFELIQGETAENAPEKTGAQSYLHK